MGKYVKVKQDRESSVCPKCQGDIYLLMNPKKVELAKFYVCTTCDFIGQVGEGIVEESN